MAGQARLKLLQNYKIFTFQNRKIRNFYYIFIQESLEGNIYINPSFL
jgi:hypothetical protein